MKIELNFGDVKGEQYEALLEHCYATCDFFMVVYRYCRQKKLPEMVMAFREKLRDYCVKTRDNASWPGTPGTYSNDFKYRVCFYKTNLDTKKLLAEAGHLYGFDGETFPQDLAFFRGNWCFLYTTVHEELSTIVHPQKADIKFMIEQGISYTKHEYRNPEVAERKYAEELWKNGIPYELNVEARKKLWEELDSCLFEKLVNDEVKT